MTVTALPVRNEYTGTAAQVVFNYTFLIFTNADLNVYITPSGSEADDSTDITTAYTVDSGTIGNPAGGFITLNSGVSAGDLVTIVSNIVDDRTTDYQNSGDFLSDTVNDDFDRVVSIAKQIDDRSGRTLAFQESLQNVSALTFPNPAATLFLRWKSDLTGLENIDITGLGAPTDSSLITYNAANNFTGGVSRTQENKNSEILSVKDFGAAGDGVTDDTVAIQAAFDSFVNGRIFFPKGNYLVSSAITVATNDTLVYGEGMLASTVITNSETADIFDITAGASAVSRVFFEDIGVSASVTKSSGAGFSFQRTAGGGIQRAYIQKQFRGIRVTGTPNSTVLFLKDILIPEIVATTGIGISIENGNDHYMQNILVSSTIGSECLGGYSISATGAVWMDNCGSLFCGDGLRIVPGAGQVVSFCFFNRCAFDTGTGAGILIVANSATATIRGITFTDCWASSNDLSGVSITGIAGGVLDGVYFNNQKSFNNGERGLTCSFGENIHLNNCEVSGNSQSSPGTFHGIEFSANISQFSVLNTMSGTQAGFGGTQGYGVVTQAGTGDNYRIQGCDLRGNVTGGLLDSAAGTNRQVFGNLPFENADSFNLGGGASITRHLSATDTWDPPSLANGVAAGTNITVTGAAVGDTVVASLSTLTNADWQISGFVVSANTCRVTIVNHTGGVLDLPSGTLRADVWKH